VKSRKEPRPIRRVGQKLIEENNKKKRITKNHIPFREESQRIKILRKIMTDVTNF